MANFPNSVTTFTTKNAGDVIQPADVNDLQNEVNAIEAGYLNGTARLNSSASTVATLRVLADATFSGPVLSGDLMNISGPVQIRNGVSYTASTTVTPASTGNTNDLAISSVVTQVRLNISGNSTITGLAMAGGAFDGQMLWLWNVGGGTCNLPHQTGSASTGQWICPQNTAVSLKTNGGVQVRYDTVSGGAWRILLPS